jgi:D-inositol-3-phosphate glycosyltransferase
MRKLLWIGDAVVATGFAKCTHQVLDVLRHTWDVHVLGINYDGDPHSYPYPIYPASRADRREDGFGQVRSVELGTKLKPDVILIQNDPWNIPMYLEKSGNAQVVANMPVDGKNCRGEGLNGLAHAIFWTKFGADEAAAGGYRGPSSIIPLGVDLNIYHPKPEGYINPLLQKLPEYVRKGFIVGCVGRNQPRKRLDLTIAYFAEWVRTRGIEDAYLFLHVAPTGDQGYDVRQLARYYGLAGKMIILEPEIGPGVEEKDLLDSYDAFDVHVSTTQGEGWGLCTMESMACGTPQIVPDWSAFGEWIPDDAAIKVPCSEICVTPNTINAIGGVADRQAFLKALDALYGDTGLQDKYSMAGLELVQQPQFRWENIGKEFARVLEGVVMGRTR